ncbi:MAG: phosphoribosylamine--glycine ligase [Candidatus Cloacimonetes bacterium]|nr:phosphoribosylamine--glycine ligase [Candidatus Cloacimonadota bacterium]
MNIAVIGSGGREHAIAWKLEQSNFVEKVFSVPGNGGTKNNVDLSIDDFNCILEFCSRELIELIVIGPENPLANGIMDFFKFTPVKVFGPDKAGAQLEASKIFAKKFMQKYGVATADFWEFGTDQETVSDNAKKITEELNGRCVIKYDGLAGGKGVFVCSSTSDANVAIDDINSKYGTNSSYLIEKKLRGDEISILAFTDGEDYQLLLPSQDHKQLLDNDKGPNTGGMGAFCPVPFYNKKLRKQIEDDIITPTMEGIRQEGFIYKGVIYFGIMVTENGPKLLEYNVRMGDPETEVVLPALKCDFLELILACFDGTLKEYKMEFNSGFYLDVVLASGGYPKAYQIDHTITGLSEIDDLVFHAGTKLKNGNLLTSGGRVLNIVAHGDTLDEAIDKAYLNAVKVHFKNIYFRKDIGTRQKLIQ